MAHGQLGKKNPTRQGDRYRAFINVANVATDVRLRTRASAVLFSKTHTKTHTTMKLTKVEVSCTFNAGNYESVKLGGEWEIESPEEIGSAMQNALNAIRAEWERMKAQKVETPATVEKATQNEEKTVSKRVVDFGSPILQKIVDRVMTDKSVTMEVITAHYDLTDDARKVIEAAILLNK